MTRTIEIKKWTSKDIENSDFENFKPEDPAEIRFLLEMEIGDISSDTGELFTINVVSPYAVKKYDIKPKDIYEKFVFINSFNWDKLKFDIGEIVEDSDEGNIQDSMEGLLRFFNLKE